MRGYVPNALLTFRSGSKSGDYQDDMNHANYKKWLQEKIIPNLESKSAIVVDSASYHNAQINWHQTSNVTKCEMLFWLDKYGMWYSSDMVKAEFYDLIKMHRSQITTFATVCSPTMDTL